MLRLLDLLNLAKVELKGFKIHCATPSSATDSPLTAYLEGRFQGWQQYQSRKNFRLPHIVSLIKLPSAQWLFAGVYQVNGHPTWVKEPRPHWEYSTTEVPGLEHLSGRVIIAFPRSFRQPYVTGSRYAHNLEVSQILPAKYSLRTFPGFKSVLVSHAELRQIISRRPESWHTALSSIGGVYLITDRLYGRHYVGSAYGVGGIWARWSAYAASGHGGNKDLVELIGEKGIAHAENFQYALLEILSPMEAPDVVFHRENHWKLAMGSRDHGYNKN